ncbi:MAG: ketoacyl-ACP synthase III [Rhodospirillaceae bacterium]|jgi:3-oxoacyl-[acyl-carrier-protein] synthase III|nr:ketoacyl-ACP synthase III [Rhodospirillaceae bacterium]MBT4219285.1 ketoacyl-ACP synthase III [Rhodospirillaceae bacterium]MBT4463076.1 ketoacyl-ACP synthase III [Rhodospirillaceae bacterium]MBT5309367.1 ketoacyl-ACP synthase III [Rhodospirillaceae bacterium]MBT6406268.1 ketoacyl-ACP synthase III [Rhodospirillaceae bacterium]
MKARIEDISYALPGAVVTNDALHEAHPEWDFTQLEERTGVSQRCIASPDETALDLAETACRDLDLDGVDGLLFCTETPDHPIPPNSCILHGRLELPETVLALDINMGCSGYVYGLELARALIVAGSAKKVLLVTGDTYSRLINPGDRATRVVFGDGVAASLIVACEDNEGILDISLGTAGKLHDRFIVPAGGTRLAGSDETRMEKTDKSGNVRTDEDIVMDGFGMLSFVNAKVPVSVKSLLESNKLGLEDVDVFVFHQASKVVLESLQRNLKISDDKMINNMNMTGNLVSASVPVSLKIAIDAGQAKPGNLALLCGFGVGLSWATALVRL